MKTQIRKRTRKSDSQRKNLMLKAGGGPPPEDDHNSNSERVRSILPTIDLEIENEYDSIAVVKNEKKCRYRQTRFYTRCGKVTLKVQRSSTFGLELLVISDH